MTARIILRPGEILAFERGDISDVLKMMAAFNFESGYPFSKEICQKMLFEILDDPSLGCIWIAKAENLPVGYLALCFCFSFEHGGRDAFVDELFVVPHFRRFGIAKSLLNHVCGRLPDLKIAALHLEVENSNLAAQNLYARNGFRTTDRSIMTYKMG